MQSSIYEAIKTKQLGSDKIKDDLVVEAALQININGEPYTVVMRTPGDDLDLLRGLLYAEDIYRGKTPFTIDFVEQKQNGFSIINVKIPKEQLGKGYMNKRTLLSVSSCGICGKQELGDIELSGTSVTSKSKLNLSDVKRMYHTMSTKQLLFQTTGGSHATAAFDLSGNLLSIKEDIGRHNALDKVVGNLLNQNQLSEAACILVSGRVSYEIISKAFFAKVPVVVAVSACSSLAVDYAKEFGICLIGFSREERSTIYSNQHHINL